MSSVVFSQPCVATLPPRTSTDDEHPLGAVGASTSRSSSGSVKAAVPRITRAAPARSASSTAAARAQAAAVLDRHAGLGGDPPQVLEVDRLAGLGAVEVDHVQRRGARLDPAARRRQRVGVVDLLGLEVALDQAHGVAVEDVDRRVEPHRATGAPAATQMRAKLASSRSPAAEDFSGWNWTP